MSRPQTKTKPKLTKSPKSQAVVSQDESEESEVEIELDREIGKDATEEELERLVFGDSAGFQDGLGELALGEADDTVGVDGETGLEGLDDADLFYTDTGDLTTEKPDAPEDGESEDDTILTKQPPAWEDNDDERMMISLASAPRLRKLRRTEAEDVVNGKVYAKRLRQQYHLLHPAPEWAQTAMQRPASKRRRTSYGSNSNDDDEMDIDNDLPPVTPIARLLQNAESLVRDSGPGLGKKRKLRSGVIDVQRQKDIPGVQPSAITSLSFHPRLPLLLSSGPSSTLYLHHLAPSPPAPTPNPLLTSLHLHGSKLTTTAFHPHDSRIFLSGRSRYFHVWDLDSGRVEKVTRVLGQTQEQRTMERFKLSPDGNHMALVSSSKKAGGVVNILDAATLQWSCQVRIESRNGLADFAWWRDSRGLTLASKGGEITEWDVAAQSVVARWQDEGAVGTTTLALGGQHEFAKSAIGTDRWIAVGSSSGIVNIYDRRTWLQTSGKGTPLEIPENPKPAKMLDHITTPTSNLAFSHDGQVLAMSSKWKRDALRLVHLPSCTVFQNWPTSNTPLGRITGVAFAAGDAIEGGSKGDMYGVLAVANEQGKIRVFEIR